MLILRIYKKFNKIMKIILFNSKFVYLIEIWFLKTTF